jgi:hypothetical protein
LKQEAAKAVLDEQFCPGAEAAMFLASAKSDWITGVTLDINAGILIS